LMLTVRKDAIVVPLAAIQRGTQGSYVYTVTNGHANLQPVKVDLTQGNISLIASGVAAGDQVVVDGQDRLQAGTQVEAHSATPNGAASGSGGGQNADSTGGKGGGHRPAGNPNAPDASGKNSGNQGEHKQGQPGKQN
jgi:multidrug efflux system membrane fusion protein